jgi:phosphate transport system ATP-binding protein
VVVTHNLAQAQRIADRAGLFWLQEGTGKLIEFGERDRVFDYPQHALSKAYISGQRG